MAGADYGLLFTSLPQTIQSPATGVLTGMQQAQEMARKQQETDSTANLQNAQAKELAQKMNINQVALLNDGLGSLALLPQEQRPAGYQQFLTNMKRADIDMSDMPKTYSPQIDPWINSAAITSKQALEWKKAEAELQMKQLMMGSQLADANIKARENGYTPPFPGAPGATDNNQGMPQVSLTPSSNTQTNSGQTTPTTFNTPVGTIVVGNSNQTSTSQQQPTTIPQTPQPGSNQINVQPDVKSVINQSSNNSPITSGNTSSDSGPVGMAGNKTNIEEQAKNWQDLGNRLASNAIDYESTKADTNLLLKEIKDEIIPTGPGPFAFIKKNSMTGQAIEKVASNLKIQSVRALASGGGLGRVMQAELGFIDNSLPDVHKWESVNTMIGERILATNEIIRNIYPRLYNQLDQFNQVSAKNPALAGILLDQTIKRAKIYNPDGTVNLKNFDKLIPSMNEVVNDFKQGKLNNTVQVNNTPVTSNFKPDDIFISPQGVSGNYQQLEEAAKTKGMTVDQFIQTHNLKKKIDESQQQQSPQQPTPSPQQQQASNAINLQDLPGYKIAQSVAPMESGGNYKALGQIQKNGDRAIGKYQVMASNIAPWTKEILGKPLSVQEFLNNPVIQDIVASVKLHQYYQKYGNPADAVSMWFSGKPFKGNNRRDSLGTSTPVYVNAALRHLSNYASL